ncbi:transmembrane protein, putative [Medicago truncatula]|uniref:Transmembrane protein, putative n=1 Tax=Medicago truncatula TaxID=3880 RepID=G8A0C0_MEDTR|nr:transmembrane protein, putative [Medicago truncatula]
MFSTVFTLSFAVSFFTPLLLKVSLSSVFNLLVLLPNDSLSKFERRWDHICVIDCVASQYNAFKI